MSAALCLDSPALRRGGGLRVDGGHQLGQCSRRTAAKQSPSSLIWLQASGG